jgi:hypothetical protein
LELHPREPASLPKIYLGHSNVLKRRLMSPYEVITGHRDFYALVASCGAAATFIKVGCNHARAVNRPNFNLSSSDLVDVPTEAQSRGNRFITQIWAKGGRELAGDEARKLLNTV